ncbi:MAG: hypothetical protein NT076_04505 [Candidatus Pacearchaeota archaeon]|nr:hypothetical protein [Candidatus Pacearchaeota archaeon]
MPEDTMPIKYNPPPNLKLIEEARREDLIGVGLPRGHQSPKPPVRTLHLNVIHVGNETYIQL